MGSPAPAPGTHAPAADLWVLRHLVGGGEAHSLAWTAAFPPRPYSSPESLFWVCPAPGLLAASLERHETGSSLTGMWHSLGTCLVHVLP